MKQWLTQRLWLSLTTAVWWLTGCATKPNQPLALHCSDNALSEGAQSARRAWFRTHPIWRLSGRAALRFDHRGATVQLNWEEREDGQQIDVVAPLTHQHWRLLTSTRGKPARLEGVEDGPHVGPDARKLLWDATGFLLPVNEITNWVRGIDMVGPVERERLDRQQPSSQIEQKGWTIDYQQWQCPLADQPALPHRLQARNNQAQLRLIIDHWDFSPL